MRIRRLFAAIGASLTLALGLPLIAAAATTNKTVTPDNTQGWVFNPDPTTQTPYEFNEDEHSTLVGKGSLYVKPIGSSNPKDKFIAQKPLGVPVEEFESVSYDFLIAGNGGENDADQFYLNVYTVLKDSPTDRFYDCRYDYTPSEGSTTEFTTATFSPDDTPAQVGDRTAGGDNYDCPDTLAELPAGSTVKAITINVGDTSASDAGLAGYLDNVVIKTAGNVASYNFELNALNKEQCKNNGYKNMKTESGASFKNQGDCVSYFASNGKAQGNQQQTTSNKPQF